LGGSSSSTTPHACSNSFFARKPLARPPITLNGMNRSFMSGHTVYRGAGGGIPDA